MTTTYTLSGNLMTFTLNCRREQFIRVTISHVFGDIIAYKSFRSKAEVIDIDFTAFEPGYYFVEVAIGKKVLVRMFQKD